MEYVAQPEIYYAIPNEHVPNSHFPLLIYRNVLTQQPLTPESVRSLFESHSWNVASGQWIWGEYATHHIHSTTHECYGVISGSSRLLFGIGPLDALEKGVQVNVEKGDVIVVPAGVAHCTMNTDGNYTYVAVYPAGSPQYDMHYANAKEDVPMLAAQAKKAPRPIEDPVYGKEGPLLHLWKEI